MLTIVQPSRAPTSVIGSVSTTVPAVLVTETSPSPRGVDSESADGWSFAELFSTAQMTVMLFGFGYRFGRLDGLDLLRQLTLRSAGQHPPLRSGRNSREVHHG
jgi:hypothetical protein